ncbi:MAG: sugar ABC transporter permease [Firmicutes bacterium]|nr:sugar ABC transporter permease [Bacillota bacterium]
MKRGNDVKKKEQIHYHMMVLPGTIIVFLFNTATWLGIFLAFQDFVPSKGWFGSPWVGMENFKVFFSMPDSFQIIRNTLIMAVGKIIFTMLTAIVFALLLNEILHKGLKRSIQTAVYLPHFVSWVIFAIIMRSLFDLDGIINRLLLMLGLHEPILFLGIPKLFPIIMIITHVLKEFGFSAIIYLAAITNVDPCLYEASFIDGANSWQKVIYVTLPCIAPIIVLMATLSLGNILNAGFDQIFNMYNPTVYSTGDIIDTYVYRVGLMSYNYGIGSAIGLFKSVISFVLMILANWLAVKFADYHIF